MTLNGVMALTLRYFTEFGKRAFQHITAIAHIELIDHLKSASTTMGVDHGGTGTSPPPQNLERRIVLSPDFVMLQNFKHQITCITM